jgi:hypothetical protein
MNHHHTEAREGPVSDQRVLRLYSDGLLSKFGFNDGDQPDDVADWLEADGIEYGRAPWHPVLRRLVREHLLPVIDQNVAVYDIETIHNPIRAETVDGVQVDDYQRDPTAVPTLTPDHVDVPYAVVLAAVREEIAREGGE